MQREEIDLKDFFKIVANRAKIFFVVLLIMIVIGIVYLTYDYFMNHTCNMTILVNGNNEAISKILESLNTEKVTGTFEKSTATIEIISKNTDEELAREGLEQYYIKLKEKTDELCKNVSYSEVTNASFEERDISYYIKVITICIAMAIILYLVYVWIIFDMSVTTNEYELFNLTGLKVMGDNREKNNSILINTNIELNKDLGSPKTILFVNADGKTDNSLVISKIAKEYMEENYSVLIVGDIKNITTENISLKNCLSKKDIESILSEIKEKYDKILICGEKISDDYKTNILSNIADTSIIVARAQKTKIDNILMTKKYIEYVGGKISGIILE